MIFYLGVIKLQNIMKIKLDNLDTENFMSHEHILNGEVVTLIQPKNIGAKWTQDNLHFRSSVWNYNGELISASFPKFFNWGEQPDISPVPTSLKNCTIVEKLDGSTLIVSKYKGQYILRTRGTIDASTLANGHELELFKQKILIPLVEKMGHPGETWEFSILFEWVSPINKIVLNYGDEPDWYLIGMVWHSEYHLSTQFMLDSFAKGHNLKRPATYTFSDVNDLLRNVEQWKGKEGVVVYGKMPYKYKSEWYLVLHHMKSELASLEKVMDVWLEQGMPDYQTFYNYIFTTFDYELAEQCRGMISRICDARKGVDQIVAGMTEFVDTKVRKLSTRKDQAQLVLSAYGNTNRASYVFALLDGKTLTKDQLKKLMFQVLKN